MESLNLPSILTPDFGLLFWMLVAFVALFLILAKFGFPAITKTVEARKNFIDDSLQNARRANEKLAGIQAESEKVLREAREKQAAILKEAAETRNAIVAEAKSLAAEEGAKLLAEAKQQILVEKANALLDIRAQVADLSIQVAEKMVAKELKKNEAQTAYINDVLDDIERTQ